MRRTLILCSALMIALAGTVSAERAINETRPAVADGTVEIENIAGTVEVVGWGKNQVEVTGTLGDGTEELEIREDGSRISIEVKVEKHRRHVDGSDLTIRVPSGSSLMVETVSANIDIDGVDGRLELESVSGNVKVAGSPRELRVENVSGKIEVATAPADSELASVSGSIEVGRATDELDAESVSGNVLIRDGSLSRGDLSTVSGKIECRVDLVGRGSIELESMSGTLALFVPAGAGADFELSTFSGHIDNELGPAAKRTSRYTPGEEVSFSTGSGPSVRMNSFSGSVKLLKQ